MIYGQLLLGCLAMYISLFSLTEDRKLQQDRIDGGHQTVVVELFTSEGCSTCPLADNFLAQLSARQRISGVEVIALEEHVDYWNHDGWFDPFSSAEWTSRQQDYAARLSGSGTYTPQMIVDGQRELVGSREADAQQAIQDAAHREKAKVALTEEGGAGGRIKQFKVSVETLPRDHSRDNAEVWMAVTEGNLRSAVRSGENAGKDLPHSAVLRVLHKIGLVPPDNQSSWSLQRLRR